MKLAFSTLGCPKWALERIAEFAGTSGYDGVELRVHANGVHMFENASIDDARRISKIFIERGTRIFSLKTYCNFGSHIQDELVANQNKLHALLALASAMDVRYVRVFAGLFSKHKDEKSAVHDVVRYLTPCAKRAKELGITIGIETHDDWAKRLNLLVEVVNGIGTGTGIVWDFVNVFFASNIDVATQYVTIGEYVVYCHVKDAVRTSEGKVKPVAFGTGSAPVRELVEVLKKDNKDIYLSCESEKMWHPELPEPEEEFPSYLKQMRQLLNS